MKFSTILTLGLILSLNAKAETMKADEQFYTLDDLLQSIIDGRNNPDDLDRHRPSKMIRNLYQLDSLNINTKRLKNAYWPQISWPLKKGMIAARYNETAFTLMASFQSRRAWIEKYPMRDIVGMSASDRMSFMSKLSPAEKYDLLIGDLDASLTMANWDEGEYFDRRGTMGDWMGVCEGSAAASAFFPEPIRAVELPSKIDGITVKFEAKDIKALAGLMWSEFVVPDRDIPIIGRRCRTNNPPRNSDGRITSGPCADTNPGTFHIALLNFVGAQEKPLFIDHSPGVEVWNWPINIYEVEYFHPEDRSRRSKNLKKSLVSYDDFYKRHNDKRKQYRSPGTKFMVGVKVKFWANPQENGYQIQYDLELDGAGNIIGGEWHTAHYPDFMWTIPDGLKPQAMGDASIPSGSRWDIGARAPLPGEWILPALQSAIRIQPLMAIVEKLVEASAR
jgi:hypothetical protein